MLIHISHNPNMARRGKPKGFVPWYLPEWMEASGLKGRGARERMRELTGWSKATMSQLYNDNQDFSPKILAEAAQALNCQPYELLMRPEAAMAIRQLRQDALRIVEGTLPPSAPAAPAQKRRKAG